MEEARGDSRARGPQPPSPAQVPDAWLSLVGLSPVQERKPAHTRIAFSLAFHFLWKDFLTI